MWFPYMFARFLGVVVSGPKSLATVQNLQTAASILSTMNYCLNVFIYSLTNRDFLQAFKRIVHMKTNKVHSTSGTVSDA
jgi:hypothetical protein